MSTIPLSYTESGFVPSTTTANPGDLIVVTNDSENDISLSFAAGEAKDPLIGLTSPVDVQRRGGQVQGTVNVTASNHVIVFSADGYEANVEVGPAYWQITVSPEGSTPTEMSANPLDVITFYNESSSTSVTLDVDSPTTDPFGPELGMSFSIDPTANREGLLQASARNTKVKVTVKGSSSQPTTIDVGSGDVEGVLARQAASSSCG